MPFDTRSGKFFDEFSGWSFCRQIFNSAAEPLRDIASRVHDLRADKTRTQDRHPDAPRCKRYAQSLGQRHDAVFGRTVRRDSIPKSVQRWMPWKLSALPGHAFR